MTNTNLGEQNIGTNEQIAKLMATLNPEQREVAKGVFDLLQSEIHAVRKELRETKLSLGHSELKLRGIVAKSISNARTF
jgi:hypothetical protein